MRNKYPGHCVHCGNPVPAGQGHFQRSSKEGNKAIGIKGYYPGKWFIRCLPCVDRIREEKEAANNEI